MKYVESFLFACLVSALIALLLAVMKSLIDSFGPEGLLWPMLFLIVWKLTHAFIKEVID